jgi:hypothetical protein
MVIVTRGAGGALAAQSTVVPAGLWPGEGRHRLTRPEIPWPVDGGRTASMMLGEAGGGRRRSRAPQLARFLPIFMTAPVFAFVCGLLLGHYRP